MGPTITTRCSPPSRTSSDCRGSARRRTRVPLPICYRLAPASDPVLRILAPHQSPCPGRGPRCRVRRRAEPRSGSPRRCLSHRRRRRPAPGRPGSRRRLRGKHPGIKFTYDTSLGSDGGVNLTAQQALELGMASRDLTTAEMEVVDGVLIGVAGTGLVVHQGNTLKDLTTGQGESLYSGTV